MPRLNRLPAYRAAQRPRDPRVLDRPVPLREEVVPLPHDRGAAPGRLGQRLDLAPRLGPRVAAGLPEGAGVLAAEDRRVRVVVDQNLVRPPPHDHWGRGAEAGADTLRAFGFRRYPVEGDVFGTVPARE